VLPVLARGRKDSLAFCWFPFTRTFFVRKKNSIMGAVKSLDEELFECLTLLSKRQKKTVLTVVKSFVAAGADWWDELGEAQQKAIDQSLAEAKAGKLTPHVEVMKKYDKWLKK
jgi:predicted transcriptional regulator